MTNRLLEVHSVSKVYYADEIETHAVSDVSFDLNEGDYSMLTGPSGCGKSTLLSILGLIEQPTVGDYSFKGIHTSESTDRELSIIRNKYIGFVFQAFNLIGRLSVLENVALPLEIRGEFTKSTIRRRVDEVLDLVGLTNRKNHFPGQLSGGQQQRVAIARGLVVEPALLIADEPTGNLDSENGNAIMEILRDLHSGGMTIVLATHDAGYGSDANKVLVMSDGKLRDQ